MTFTHRRTRHEDSSLFRQRITSAIPAVIATGAFVCSYAGNFYCNVIQFAPNTIGEKELDMDQSNPFRSRTNTFGIWTYKDIHISNQYNGEMLFSENCVGYDRDTDFDTLWTVARIGACLAVLASGLLMLWQWFAPFLLFDNLYWRWAMFLFALIGICQGATILFLFSSACFNNPVMEEMVTYPELYPNECSLDWGAFVAITSTLLYFLTLASLCIISAPGFDPTSANSQ